jgi:hypothetical protein
VGGAEVAGGAVVAGGVVVEVEVGVEQDGEDGFSWHSLVVTRLPTYRRALATDDSCTPDSRAWR